MNTTKINQDTQTNDTTQEQERVTRELRTAKRDRRGNVLESKESLAAFHEATRLVLFLRALSHIEFIQDRAAYGAVHRECSKYINTYEGGITRAAEDQFGWCTEVRDATADFHAYWESRPRYGICPIPRSVQGRGFENETANEENT